MAPRKTAAEKAAEKAKITGGAPAILGPAPVAPTSGFEWAVHKPKLARAIVHVTETQPDLKHGSKEHEAAVKERYLELKGLVTEDAGAPIPRPKKKGGVVNLADNDGSADDEDEEEGEE